jgi:hypothetical protein
MFYTTYMSWFMFKEPLIFTIPYAFFFHPFGIFNTMYKFFVSWAFLRKYLLNHHVWSGYIRQMKKLRGLSPQASYTSPTCGGRSVGRCIRQIKATIWFPPHIFWSDFQYHQFQWNLFSSLRDQIERQIWSHHFTFISSTSCSNA